MTKKRIMAIVLIGVLLISLVVGVFVAVFSLNSVKPAEDRYVAEDGEGNKLETGNVYELPSRLLFGESANGGLTDSLTFCVTIEPLYATDKTLFWQLDFQKFDGWANGKNIQEYMSLEVKGFNATVRCLKPFGEKIVLTAKPNSNPDISASCVMDFRKKVIDVESPLLGKAFEGEWTLPPLNISANSTQNMYDLLFGSLKWIESVGTLPVEYQENGLPKGVTLPEYKEGTINGQMMAVPHCAAESSTKEFGAELSAVFEAPNNLFFYELWDLSPKAFFEKHLYLNEYPERAADFIKFLKKYDNERGFLQMIVGGRISNFGEYKNFTLQRYINFTDLERKVTNISSNVEHAECDGYVENKTAA